MINGKVQGPQLEMFRRELLDNMKSALVAVAADALVSVRMRVAKGVGLDDKPMKAYSPGYAKRKKAKGRQTKKRDLTMTGTMLGSLHVADVVADGEDNFSVAITLGDARSKQLALYNQQTTPWFGFSKNDLDQIEASTKDHFGG